MLKKLILENYRCFEKTEITFRELSIVVGKNNAGKSTLIEALRILSLVVTRSKSMNYTEAPDWVYGQKGILGVRPSINNLEIAVHGLIYMYGDGPANINAEFEKGQKISIYISNEADVFAILADHRGVNIESKRFARALRLQDINILPQISPLMKDEPVIKLETVQRNALTSLSSRNFRNQLNYYPTDFDKFKVLAEKTWQGLMIDSTSKNIRTQGNLFLFVRNLGFEGEIGTMGHGLQMWLQTMWFLCRCPTNSTVILDEPDVYMHADLQRQLIKMVKANYKQVIVATHSVEIMSEVEPDNILPIVSSKPKQEYANKLPMVQKIITDIGSVHNLEIARMFSYNKFLIVEGEKDDVKLLSIFQSKIFPHSFETFDVLPKTFVEGWGGWQRVIGSNKVFRDNKTSMMTYCLFDSDYHTDDQKESRLADAKTHDLNLHIWKRKEIENYLLVPDAIARAVHKKRKSPECTPVKIAAVIDGFCEDLRMDLCDSFATELKRLDSIKDIKTVNQEARAYVTSKWEDQKYCIVPGKMVLSKVFAYALENFKVSLNKFTIAREMTLSEIAPEMIKIITCIENRTDF